MSFRISANEVLISECRNFSFFPNISFFRASPLRPNQFQPACDEFVEIEDEISTIIDGFSFYSPIILSSVCFFDKSKIPDFVYSFSRGSLILWNATYNEFYDFWIEYIEEPECQLWILPKIPYKEKSMYVLVLKKKEFEQFLKPKYYNQKDEIWEDFKSRFHIQSDFHKRVMHLFKEYHNQEISQDVVIVFPVRSSHGIISPILQMRGFLKKAEIQITKKISIYEKRKKKTYEIEFRLSKYPEESEEIHYVNPKIKEKLKKRHFKFYFFYPDDISEKTKILVSNVNLWKYDLYQELLFNNQYVLISYEPFQDAFLNFISDILIYENMSNFINEINKKIKTSNITKICSENIECLISSFYQDKVDLVILHQIHDLDLINERKQSFVQKSQILKKWKKAKNLSNFYKELLISDIYKMSLYFSQRRKLQPYLNYDFKIQFVSDLYSDEISKILFSQR
ncbi:MAG: hypothetical protein NZ853_01110 [Leptospiraceae bacterium]|nr:hypothetical protein [Leptospiraceae bacterium]MDW7976172.1 hypothetical protein [Leptospiraceae bacterium]